MVVKKQESLFLLLLLFIGASYATNATQKAAQTNTTNEETSHEVEITQLTTEKSTQKSTNFGLPHVGLQEPDLVKPEQHTVYVYNQKRKKRLGHTPLPSDYITDTDATDIYQPNDELVSVPSQITVPEDYREAFGGLTHAST